MEPPATQHGLVGALHHFVCEPAVHAFIQPGLLEFIRGEHPVEKLVTEFVDRHNLRFEAQLERIEGHRTRGDEGRILHAVRAAGFSRCVHNGERGVGVAEIPVLRKPQRRLHSSLLALEGIEMFRLVEVVDFDVPVVLASHGPAALGHHRPGKIMDVFGMDLPKVIELVDRIGLGIEDLPIGAGEGDVGARAREGQ